MFEGTNMVPRGLRRSENGFTLVELMITVAVMGIVAAMAFEGFGPKKTRLEMENARRDVVSLVRSARTSAAALGRPVTIVMRTDGVGDRVEAILWNDADNNWVFGGDAEVESRLAVALIETKPQTSGQMELSTTYPGIAEVAGCNNGLGNGDPTLAIFLPNGMLIDSAENVCTFRIYLHNPNEFYYSAIEVRPGGQSRFADNF